MVAKHDEGRGSVDTGWPPAGPLSDEPGDVIDHLLAKVARGDQEAFASIYHQVIGTVYSLVQHMVVDPALSQDVTRDVLTEVWRTASLFRPSAGSGMSWIVAIARRLATGHVRTVRAALGVGAVRPLLARIVREVAEQAEVSPRGEAAAGALASLPEPQRHALLLACYGGYTQGQVADLFGVSVGTASGWIRDGLLLLRGRPQW